jgi:hypothetical protein
LIEPEDGCDADVGDEGMRASVVSGVDAAPILERPEHDFDLVALAVKHGVVRDWSLRFAFDGMQAAILRSAKVARNQSAW